MKKKVSILIATYNGEKYLKRQLESLYKQDIDIEIYASDDGSNDNTLNILHEYQQSDSSIKLYILQGPQKGFAQNFISLIHQMPLENNYYAFCDQDDIWHPQKLSKAVEALQNLNQNTPLLYCSRTQLINHEDKEIGYSPLFTKKPNFKNALVQNIGGGNTMVFNQKTLELLKQTSLDNNIVSHDWWTYLLVTGAGGEVIYSPSAHIQYRQHNANLIGSNQGVLARIKRINALLKGKFQNWNTRNLTELSKLSFLLEPKNQKILNQFIKAKQSRFPFNLVKYARLRLYRQTMLGNLGLYFAIIFNKI